MRARVFNHCVQSLVRSSCKCGQQLVLLACLRYERRHDINKEVGQAQRATVSGSVITAQVWEANDILALATAKHTASAMRAYGP